MRESYDPGGGRGRPDGFAANESVGVGDEHKQTDKRLAVTNAVQS